MSTNILCLLGIHNWEIYRYLDQDSLDEIKEVRCKRCEKENHDIKLFRKLTGKKVSCNVCFRKFRDTEGHTIKYYDLPRLNPKSGSKGAEFIERTSLFSLVVSSSGKSGGLSENIYYICEKCYKRDFQR